MREPNARVRPRERFELSLDGRQVASIVVGALVILGVVFVLGLNVGKQIALRQAEVALPGDLDALDRAPAAAPAVEPDALTFHDRLTREAPPPAPPPAEVTAAAPAPAPAPVASPPPAAEPAPEPGVPLSETPPDAAWTVQLAAAQDQGEAERIARRFSALNARIEVADVPGKGRFYRVRVGAFDTRESADRYLRDVARETGAKGFVTPAR